MQKTSVRSEQIPEFVLLKMALRSTSWSFWSLRKLLFLFCRPSHLRNKVQFFPLHKQERISVFRHQFVLFLSPVAMKCAKTNKSHCLVEYLIKHTTFNQSAERTWLTASFRPMRFLDWACAQIFPPQRQVTTLECNHLLKPFLNHKAAWLGLP